MSSSSVVSNHHVVTNPDRSKRKKKKKAFQTKDDPTRNHAKWKSEAQQQIYSSKLIQALNQVTITGAASSSNSTSSSSSAAGGGASSVSVGPSAPKRGRAVREAADRALAVAAKGRSRWSRAILTNRLKLKFRKQKRQKVPAPPSTAAVATASGRSRKQRFSVLKLKGKSLPTVQRKVRFLGRLVPGCRKQPLPVILEEATDYIAALEMQVRAMTALAELLSGSGGSSSSAAAPPPTT